MVCLQQMRKSTSMLLSAAQMQWNGIDGLFATNAQINIDVAFSGTNALECLIQSFGGLDGLFATNAQINLDVAFSGTNAVE